MGNILRNKKPKQKMVDSKVDGIVDKKQITKLSKAKVIEIKMLLKEGKLTVKEIASKYEVKTITIDHINKGKTWTNITV
jgi:hypothetical protein